MNRGRVGVVLKLLISAVLVVVLLRRIPLDTVLEALASPGWGWLAAAVGVFALSAVGGAVQWAWILRTAGLRTPLPEMMRLYGVGLFFNNFLPGNVGGDAVKIFDLGRRERRTVTVLGATALDRLVGLLALTILALLTVGSALISHTPLPPVPPLLVALGVWGAGLAVLLSRRLSGLAVRMLRRLPWDRPAEHLQTFLDEFAHYRRRTRWLSRLFALALVVQFLRVATHLLVGWGLGLSFDGEQVLQLFVLIPLLGILIALPISFNGLGLREIAAASLFVSVGLCAESEAVAMEFVAYLVQVVVSLVGGLFFVAGRRAANAAERAGT